MKNQMGTTVRFMNSIKSLHNVGVSWQKIFDSTDDDLKGSRSSELIESTELRPLNILVPLNRAQNLIVNFSAIFGHFVSLRWLCHRPHLLQYQNMMDMDIWYFLHLNTIHDISVLEIRRFHRNTKGSTFRYVVEPFLDINTQFATSLNWSFTIWNTEKCLYDKATVRKSCFGPVWICMDCLSRSRLAFLDSDLTREKQRVHQIMNI
jgi:hypothetical protein